MAISPVLKDIGFFEKIDKQINEDGYAFAVYFKSAMQSKEYTIDLLLNDRTVNGTVICNGEWEDIDTRECLKILHFIQEERLIFLSKDVKDLLWELNVNLEPISEMEL